MNRFQRLSVASRVFTIATILGLNLAFQNAVAMQATLLLGAISAAAMAVSVGSRLPESWIAIAEGGFAALTIGLTLPVGAGLLPYLMVPPMLAGITAGVWRVVPVILAEVSGMVMLALVSGDPNALAEQSELVAPWILAAVGTGVLGAWVRQMRGTSGEDEESYESARRLLSQLRTVTRRLSSGLDPVSLSSHILLIVNQYLNDTHSALFVRTEGGVLAPLAYRGIGARETLRPEGALIDLCWTGMQAVHVHQPSGRAGTRCRVALPLRSGSRMIGVVVLEQSGPPSPKVLKALMHECDEQTLRLDTALVFDEVRELATIEERQRLAREIHDGVAQELASLGYAVDDLSAGAVSDVQRKKLKDLRNEISRVVSELRLSIFDLRAEISPSSGLGSALSDYVRAVGSRSEMTVHLTLDESPTRLRGEAETQLLRIAQEAITNARKHSGAANLWVDCRIQPPFARVTVSDDGSGLGTGRVDSFGMKIMRERAERIGATLEISDGARSDGHSGTKVTVTVGED